MPYWKRYPHEGVGPELLDLVLSQFALDPAGIHGRPHWERVRDNGRRLARLTKARGDVVVLFALLHDSRREDDGHDPEHGPRAAEFARALAGSAFIIDPVGLDLLADACRDHGRGLTAGDVTLLTCWDADRLDLGRVGTRPRPERLGTAAARDPDLMNWAYRRSLEKPAGSPPAAEQE